MSVAAGALTHERDEPFEIPDRVREIRAQVDWSAALPAHAHGALWRVQWFVKRVLDVVLAAAALIVLAPVFLLVAAAIRLTSPGPVFYEWRVLGRHARPFVGWKFRTMVVDADALKAQYLSLNEMQGAAFKLKNDPRITPLGRWLRKYSIDELPQLWSVVKGDMSLVGPRPPSAEEFIQFEAWQWHKLAVTPGITCLWQINGRSEINDFGTWARMDLEYIRSWSIALDLLILVRTVPAVIRARGAF